MGMFGMIVSPLSTHAANYPMDGQSPVKKGCNKTGVVKKSKKISYKGTTGTVYLMYSTSCKTAWSFVKLNKPFSKKGYFVSARIFRNNDRKMYYCSNKGGNGDIEVGQSSCYSAMVYDKNPNTAYALGVIYATGREGTPPVAVYNAKTGSY